MSSESVVDVRVHAALDVLDRMLGWVLRSPGALGTSRHLELSLTRWTTIGATDAEHGARFEMFSALLSGIDALDDGDRLERVEVLHQGVAALRQSVVPVVFERSPRARLLPEEVAAERRMLAPPPPVHVEPAVTAEIRESVRALREESARDDTVREPDARPSQGDRQREDRQREDRQGERQREDRPREGRERRPGRNEGRGERSREDRPPEEGRSREERPERSRGNERQPEEGRERNREERRPEGRRSEEAAPVRVEEPREPEVRAWALGHPDHTGVPVSELGVFSAEEVAALTAADIEDVAALLLRAPVATERAGDRLVSGVAPTGPVIVRGIVRARCTRFAAGSRRYEVRLQGERGAVVCRWGEASPELRAVPAGFELGVAGRWEPGEGDEAEGGVLPGVVYDAEVLGIDGRGGDWFPRYDIDGVADARVRQGIRVALKRFADALVDHLPPELIERHKLIGLGAALRDAHFPSNVSRKGRARLAFDELLQVQLGVALMRQRQGRERGTPNAALHGLLAQALSMAGWQFTDAQESAMDEIRRDLRRSQPMARLLQADAGAGGHDVLAAALITVAEGKHQALVLCPDALTAEHRYFFAETLLRNAGLEPLLLTGPARGAAAEAIKKGETLVVFGTHALAADPPAFRKLGLVVLEEHANFGGVDLAKLEESGRPDLLVYTPTPVPAAVALSVYGHLALTTLPAPAPQVEMTVFGAEQRADAYAIAREAIERHNQVLLVFPLLRGTDLLASSEARRMAETLRETAFPGARISIFHGALSKEERFRAFDDFQHRRADVLLATTYVESGPVIPNASVVIIEHAQEYDLMRLHELRALVGQGARSGRCLLILGSEPEPHVKARIESFCRESDGWQIAELQGAEEGSEELPGFNWAEPAKDRELLIRTRQDAVRLLAVDPGLKRRVHRALLAQVRTRLGEDVSLDGEPDRPATAAGAPGGSAAVAAAQNARRKRRRRR